MCVCVWILANLRSSLDEVRHKSTCKRKVLMVTQIECEIWADEHTHTRIRLIHVFGILSYRKAAKKWHLYLICYLYILKQLYISIISNAHILWLVSRYSTLNIKISFGNMCLCALIVFLCVYVCVISSPRILISIQFEICAVTEICDRIWGRLFSFRNSIHFIFLSFPSLIWCFYSNKIVILQLFIPLKEDSVIFRWWWDFSLNHFKKKAYSFIYMRHFAVTLAFNMSHKQYNIIKYEGRKNREKNGVKKMKVEKTAKNVNKVKSLTFWTHVWQLICLRFINECMIFQIKRKFHSGIFWENKKKRKFQAIDSGMRNNVYGYGPNLRHSFSFSTQLLLCSQVEQ